VYIPLPDESARRTLFKICLGKKDHNLTEEQFGALAARSKGFSGSDISAFAGEALMVPLKRAREAWWFKWHDAPGGGGGGGRGKWEPVEPWVGFGGAPPSEDLLARAREQGLPLEDAAVFIPWGTCVDPFHVSNPSFHDKNFDDPNRYTCNTCHAAKRSFSKLEANSLFVSPVAFADCEKVLASARPTVSQKDLDEHEKYTKEFGSHGS
jgi:vacuolar protein-sorting-associated protein 4